MVPLPHSPEFTYATVCSGAEAFGKEWEQLGLEPVFHAEIEPHAAAVLHYHYPHVPNYGDFTQIAVPGGHAPVRPVRLLCGGTPCQDFSIAGLRAGIAGDKGNLTLEFLLLLKRLGSQWALWENVPGSFSSVSHAAPHPSPPPPPVDMECDGAEVATEEEYDADEDHAFNSFLAGLQELGYGYAYRTLDLQNFGVPQRRKRIFLVAHLGDWRPAAAVLFESDCLRGDIATGGKAGQEITGPLTTGASSGGGYRLGVDEVLNLVAPIAFDTTQVTSKANMSRCEPGAPCHTLSRGAHAPAVAYQCHGGSVGEMGVLRAGNGSMTGGVPFLAEPLRFGESQQDAMLFEDGVSSTLPAGTNRNGGHMQKLFAASAVRRLTPKECERLMGWDDEWTRYGIDAKGRQYELADGPRYRLCGNGWGRPVVTWIAKRILLIDKFIVC